jgi:hypothetical protein
MRDAGCRNGRWTSMCVSMWSRSPELSPSAALSARAYATVKNNVCRVHVVESNHWPHVVRYISSYAASCMLRAVCLVLHVVGKLHGILCIISRAVFSPRGLPKTCARQASGSGSVARCHSIEEYP